MSCREIVLPNGAKIWVNLDNKLCRGADASLPSVIHPDGRKEYYRNGHLIKKEDANGNITYLASSEQKGEYHLTSEDGVIKYYKDHDLHRTDGPAVLYPNGDFEYYFEGSRHRDSDPTGQSDDPAVFQHGSKIWYRNGLFHRTGGPAIIRGNGDKEYYENGQLHRLDGPAIDHVSSGFQETWVYGVKISQ
jgi:hypothetical protein